METQEKITILDLGGRFQYWQSMGFRYIDSAEITLLNLEKVEIPAGQEHFISITADATDLSRYTDKQFDLTFSNSVIEHVGNFEAQKKMATEMIRVGKHCYLQTPNKYFFMEPHFMFPFFQFLPLKLRASLVKNFKMGAVSRAQNWDEAIKVVDSIRLLTLKELKELFPNAEIHKEKFLCFTKSFYLYF